MKIHQGRVARKVVIHGINTKVGIGDGGVRHVWDGVNDGKNEASNGITS